MVVCLVSCGILEGELWALIDNGSLKATPYFLPGELHADFGELRKALERQLEECSKKCREGVVVVYGDACHPKIQEIVKKYGAVKVGPALNCIECLMRKDEREILDPGKNLVYMSGGWLRLSKILFQDRLKWGAEEAKEQFLKCKGVVFLDSLGNYKEHKEEILTFCDYAGLPFLKKVDVGLENLRRLILEAEQRLKDERRVKKR